MSKKLRSYLKFFLMASLLGCVLPSYAGYYISNTPSNVITQNIKTTGTVEPSLESFSANLVPGSLKDNLMRIVASQGWGKVVWGLSYDDQWPKHETITADSLQGLFNKILAPYHLKAVIYPPNKLIVIQAI